MSHHSRRCATFVIYSSRKTAVARVAFSWCERRRPDLVRPSIGLSWVGSGWVSSLNRLELICKCLFRPLPTQPEVILLNCKPSFVDTNLSDHIRIDHISSLDIRLETQLGCGIWRCQLASCRPGGIGWQSVLQSCA